MSSALDIGILADIARAAGVFMRGAQSMTASTEKTNVKDFVTVADIKSQNMIRSRLRKAFPDTIVLSEEDTAEQQAVMYEPGFTGYIVDPIDGTYNFKRDMRESAISIGYIENGLPVGGVVFDPYRDELYAAEQGKGATRNGTPIHVSGQIDLHGASVATSNGYDDAAAVRNFRRHIEIYQQTGVMPWSSCPGSVILALVWIACGRIDAIHHNGIKPYDCAATFVIVREAGGIVHDFTGRDAAFTSPLVLAGTPGIVAKLEAAFAKIDHDLLE